MSPRVHNTLPLHKARCIHNAPRVHHARRIHDALRAHGASCIFRVVCTAAPLSITLVTTLASIAASQVAPLAASSRSPTADRSQLAFEPDTVLRVSAETPPASPVPYPVDLSPGERLLIGVEGGVEGVEPDPEGGIPPGTLVASFAGGPAFAVAGRKLLWAAPAAGRLAFAIAQDAGRDLSGGYRVGILRLGPRGDPRQGRFPPPRLAFRPRADSRGLLELVYEDRSGLGLDLKTLQVVLDLETGERLVLAPYFTPGPTGAVLPDLPPDVELPPGVHRVTATIGDALGNRSRPATIFLDHS